MVSNPVGDHVVRTSIAIGVVDTVAVALRLLARWRSNAAFAADDALIIFGLVPLYVMIVIGHFGWLRTLHLLVHYVDQNRCRSGRDGVVDSREFGVRAWNLSSLNVSKTHDGRHRNGVSFGRKAYTKLETLTVLSQYTLTITIVKLSILILYRRIFSTVAFKRTTPIVGAAVMLWFIVALFTNLFQCRPLQAAFDLELLFTDQCIHLQAYYWGVTASNLCIDVFMLYMPLHMVWGLKLPTRQKIALSGIFLLVGMWATCLSRDGYPILC